MAFPLLFVVLCLSLGILFASSVSPPLSLLAALMCTSLLGAWIALARQKNLKLVLTSMLFSCFFLGGGLFTLNESCYKTNALTALETRDYIDFQGTLYKTPAPGLNRESLFLKVERIFHDGRIEKTKGRLRISLLPSSQLKNKLDLIPGDKIRVSARINARGGASNFQRSRTNFSNKAAGIHASAFTKSALLIEKLSSGSPLAPLRLMARLRKQLQEQIEGHFWSTSRDQITPQGAVMEALLLGQRDRMDPNMTYSLQVSGLYHLLAISGAHIAIICLFLFQLLKVLRVPKRAAYLFLMIFLVFYAFLVEGRPSVIRATLMTLMYLLGKLLWKDSHPLNAISMSALVLLVLNPFNLFTLGFQLTFAATLSILLFFPKVMGKLPRLPFRIGEVLAVTLTAQAGVIPLIATYFNRIVLSSLLLNFAALPLLSILMAGGFVFLPLSFLSDQLAGLWSQGMTFCIDSLLAVAGISSGTLAFLSYRTPTPHLWTSLGYFLSGLLLLIPRRFKKSRGSIFCIFLIFFGILLSYPFPSSSKFLKVTDRPGHNGFVIDKASQIVGERLAVVISIAVVLQQRLQTNSFQVQWNIWRELLKWHWIKFDDLHDRIHRPRGDEWCTPGNQPV
jgi:competence protein ComEC